MYDIYYTFYIYLMLLPEVTDPRGAAGVVKVLLPLQGPSGRSSGPATRSKPHSKRNLDSTWPFQLASKRHLDSIWHSKLVSKCLLERSWNDSGRS